MDKDLLIDQSDDQNSLLKERLLADNESATVSINSIEP